MEYQNGIPDKWRIPKLLLTWVEKIYIIPFADGKIGKFRKNGKKHWSIRSSFPIAINMAVIPCFHMVLLLAITAHIRFGRVSKRGVTPTSKSGIQL
jgi:hypothetical protein